jgi:tripartite-type tricarboxylate transporter receptor subunit TctC
MHLLKRFVLCVMLGLPLAAMAQGFPSRPIQIVVPFGPGGSTDVIFRMIADPLGKRFGQPVVILNRPGGGTTIGMNSVAKAPPDGYMLGVATLSFTANAAFLQRPLPYDPAKDFVPISLVFRVPLVMTVNPQVPAYSVRELIAYAKAHPGKLNYASSGIASSGHVAAALFESMTGTSMVHVPYNSLPIPGVVSGDTQVLIGPVTPALPFIRSGKLRALGVTTRQRVDVLPDVPTFAEDGVPGYEVYEWAGLVAPAGVPDAVVERIQHELAAVLADPTLRHRIAAAGAEVVAGSQKEFRGFIGGELRRWSRLAAQTRGSASERAPALH